MWAKSKLRQETQSDFAMLLSKNTTSEIVTYGEGANNVRNAIPWSGISDEEIGRYTVTAEYCPVQINVGMPKTPIHSRWRIPA